MRIYTTKNYSLFNTVGGNRNINKTHVKNLIKSISENNMLEFFPIAINRQMEVIDGQHRLEAAMSMNLPVYYTIIDGSGLKEVQQINSNIKPWKTNDYLNCFVQLNNTNYIILRDFCNKYNLSVSIAFTLMGFGKDGNVMASFKNGSFKIKNLKKAETMADYIFSIKPYTEIGVWKSRNFIEALHDVYEKVSHNKLLKQIKKAKTKIMPKASVKEYIRSMEDIYNFRLHNKINFFE